MFARADEAVSSGKPLQEMVWLICWADMAGIFEFVKCDTVTVSLSQIITVI